MACTREGERSSPRGSGQPEGVWRRHRGRSAEKSSPNASSGRPKCASARASRTGAEGARRDTMPGGGGALAAVHSGQDQAAAGQHDGSALLQPGLTCTGRTEAVLSSGARHRIWANFDRRHSSPRAPSDKMLTYGSRGWSRGRGCRASRQRTSAGVFFGFFCDSTEYGNEGIKGTSLDHV